MGSVLNRACTGSKKTHNTWLDMGKYMTPHSHLPCVCVLKGSYMSLIRLYTHFCLFQN